VSAPLHNTPASSSKLSVARVGNKSLHKTASWAKRVLGKHKWNGAMDGVLTVPVCQVPSNGARGDLTPVKKTTCNHQLAYATVLYPAAGLAVSGVFSSEVPFLPKQLRISRKMQISSTRPMTTDTTTGM